MAQTYTRQSSFSDGDTITAALFNNEYDQLVNAFAYSSSSASSTGHRHDGTAGQGGNIHTIGDLDFLNKIVVDSTNNRWGFFVEVSSAAVEQIRLSDGVLTPVTDSDVDLGTSSLYFKNAYIDTITTTGAITSSSTLQGTTITATTAFVPDASDGAALGTSSLEFSDLFLADGAVINFGDDQDVSLTHVADTGLLLSSTDQLQFGDSGTYIHQSADGVLDLVSDTEIEINATTIDINGAADVSGNLAVGGNLTVTGNATISGNLTFGDAASDTVAFSADVASNLLPSADNTYDIGASGSEWKDLYLDGTANIDSLVADTADINGGTIDGAIIGGSSAAAITGTAITGTSFVIGSADISEAELETIDGVTAGTVAASKAVVVDSNKDIGSFRNITLTGELDAGSLDVSGDADIDGTLEADAITVDGTALNEYIADTVGAMVSSNTESGITVAYEDGDNTLDFTVGTLNQDTTGTADNITVSANNSTDETVYPIFVDGATGSQGAESDTGLTYNPSSGLLTTTLLAGTLNTAAQGNVTSLGTLTALTVDNVVIDGAVIGHTGDTDLITLSSGVVTVAGEVDATSLDISGNADIDGTLEADAITVDGTALNEYIADTIGSMVGSNTETGITVTYEDGDNTLDFVIGTLNQDTTGNAATFTATANNSTDETVYPVFVDGATGSQGAETDTGFTYNPSSGNLVIGGSLTAASLDISGNTDIDGTLEADAYTVNGTNLDEYIEDTVGAMLSSNTETGITVTYEDGDSTIDFALNAAQTGITSLLATDIKIGEDDQTKIDFETADEIHFYAANAEQVYVADGIFGPQTDSDVDLGSTSVRWKDAYVDSITTTGNAAVGGNLTLTGDLTVNGTTTTVNSTTVTIDDPIFTLGGDSAPGSDDNKDRGIEFRWHNGSAAKVGFFGYDDSASAFTFVPDATNSSEVFSGTVGNAVFGDITGTLQTAAQTNITSLGTLTALTGGTGDFNWDSNTLVVDSSANRVGIGNASPDVSLDIGSFTDAVHVPTGTTAQRPGSPAAGYFRYNTTTSKFEGYTDSWGAIAGGGSGTNMDTNIYAGDGSDTTFTLSTAPDDEQNLMVFIDGVFQAHDSYSVSGTTLTFSTAPANGRVITAYHSTTTVGGSNNTINTMTGDGSDTTLTLSVAPVHENNVQVFFDGVYQSKSNYSISGTTLTFSTAPPDDVLVEAITNTNTSSTTANQLLDADGDTMIQVEESSDEDTIRMDVGGTEIMTLSSSGAVITTADNLDTLSLISTDADANVGPVLKLWRNTASPADDDVLGNIIFAGEDDAGNEHDFFRMDVQSPDVSNGAEDAQVRQLLSLAGSEVEYVRMNATGFIFNENSADLDFRVESNGNANMLFVDGGNDRVGIGTASPDGSLHIMSASAGTVDAHASADELVVEGSANAGINILSGNSSEGGIFFGDDGDNDIGRIRYDHSNNSLDFFVNAAERMTIDSSGVVHIGTTIPYTAGDYSTKLDEYGRIFLSSDVTGGGDRITFANPNGTVGTIRIDGSSTAYNTSSDYRLKENVDYTWDATTRLKQLKPARFNFIADDTKTVDGFLAHEVSSIVPEAISGQKDETEIKEKLVYDSNDSLLAENIEESDWTAGKSDGTYPSDSTWVESKTFPVYQGIDQAKLVPLLVKTIQELEARITTLEG